MLCETKTDFLWPLACEFGRIGNFVFVPSVFWRELGDSLGCARQGGTPAVTWGHAGRGGDAEGTRERQSSLAPAAFRPLLSPHQGLGCRLPRPGSGRRGQRGLKASVMTQEARPPPPRPPTPHRPRGAHREPDCGPMGRPELCVLSPPPPAFWL